MTAAAASGAASGAAGAMACALAPQITLDLNTLLDQIAKVLTFRPSSHKKQDLNGGILIQGHEKGQCYSAYWHPRKRHKVSQRSLS